MEISGFVYPIGLLVFACCMMCWLGFVAALLRWSIIRFLYDWNREVSRTSTEAAVSLVYGPLLAAGAAICAGVGVNLFTGDNPGTSQLVTAGMYTLMSLAVLVVGGKSLARQAVGRGAGLARIRHRLNTTATNGLLSIEHAQALAYAQHVQRLGDRLTSYARALTFARWVRRDWRSQRQLFALVLVALIAAALFGVLLARFPHLPNVPLGFAFCAVSTLMGAAIPLLEWRTERYALAKVGAELHESGRVLQARLHRTPPQLTRRERLHHRWKRWQERRTHR